MATKGSFMLTQRVLFSYLILNSTLKQNFAGCFFMVRCRQFITEKATLSWQLLKINVRIYPKMMCAKKAAKYQVSNNNHETDSFKRKSFTSTNYQTIHRIYMSELQLFFNKIAFFRFFALTSVPAVRF
jgi:hypothetical protein